MYHFITVFLFHACIGCTHVHRRSVAWSNTNERASQVCMVKSARVCRRHEDASHLGYGYVNFFSEEDKGAIGIATNPSTPIYKANSRV